MRPVYPVAPQTLHTQNLCCRTRLFTQVWRQYEMKHKPAAVLDVQLPPGSFDINVTPDKREVQHQRNADRVLYVICAHVMCAFVQLRGS